LVGYTSIRWARVEGFTKKDGVNRLVYFEVSESIEAAIFREKQMKKWKRSWKIGLIERLNPNGPTSTIISQDSDYWIPAFAGTTMSRFESKGNTKEC
jgi:hypothetical protein